LRETRKADIRLYVYDGRILVAAARLCQGQVVKFRIPGGGFASAFKAWVTGLGEGGGMAAWRVVSG
jgi:hypothetical protein